MRFDLGLPSERTRARQYFGQLTKQGALVELKRVSRTRSLAQNSYLHVLIGAFAQHFGYTMEEAKTIYKQLNRKIYRYEKKGRVFWRSSADITVDEMTESIELFREKSAEAGYPLPKPDNGPWLRQLENAIEQSQKFL